MTLKDQEIYDTTHKLSKAILFVLQLLLTVLITFVFVTEQLMYILPLFIAKEILYYFGVNTLAYIIEHLAHLKHLHKKL